MRYGFTVSGRQVHVTREEHADGPIFDVDGSRFTPEVERLGPGHYRVTVGHATHEFHIDHGTISDGRDVLDVAIRRARPVLTRAGGKKKAGNGQIKPPMPGKVVEVKVKEGDSVAEGDTLLVLEAMKMQNDLKAATAGTVTKVHVKDGANVEATTVLVEIKPDE